MNTSYSLIACGALTLLMTTGCGGGGGGGGPTSEPRRPETLIYLSPDRQQLMAAPDDQSVMAKTLSATPFTEISDFAVSPDGEYVAYIADQDVSGQMDLYVAEIDGDAPIKLSQLSQAHADVADFKWAPDSSKLAFRADDGSVDDRLRLYSVNVDASALFEASNLSIFISSVFVDHQYQWSPNSHYLAWVLDDPTYRQISLWCNDTRNQAQSASSQWLHFVGDQTNEEIVSFKFSPNSQYLAFRTDDFSNGNDQYIIAAAPSDGSTAAFMATGAPGTTVQIVDYAWSPDSNLLAQGVHGFPDSNLQVGINIFDVPNLLSTRIATTSEFGELHWAHHSNKLAFVAGYDVSTGLVSTESSLIVYDKAVGSLEDLNHDLVTNEVLSEDEYFWSADDSRIVYKSKPVGSETAYVVASNGQSDAQALSVPGNPSIEALSWSPDGNYISLLSLDESTAFHPGNWRIFDNQGQAVWTSADIFTFESSQLLKWASDMTRAVYSASAGTSDNDSLHSVKLDDLQSTELVSAALTNPAFDYAEESLVEEPQ